MGVGIPDLRMLNGDEGIGVDRSATSTIMTVDSSCGTFRSLLAHDHNNGHGS
jgi:hypothetical protein